jgi:hypothetical protein
VNEVNDKNKIMKQREGLLEVDGKPVQKSEAPLSHDEEGTWLHRFTPVGF